MSVFYLPLTLRLLQHSSDSQRANCRLLSEDSAAGEMLPADGWSDGQKRTAGSQLKYSYFILAYLYFLLLTRLIMRNVKSSCTFVQ